MGVMKGSALVLIAQNSGAYPSWQYSPSKLETVTSGINNKKPEVLFCHEKLETGQQGSVRSLMARKQNNPPFTTIAFPDTLYLSHYVRSSVSFWPNSICLNSYCANMQFYNWLEREFNNGRFCYRAGLMARSTKL